MYEIATEHSFDSLIEQLDELVWDGVPRIETMLSILLGAEDSDYTREAAKLLMRGAVCRAFSIHGVQFDIMLVLVGPQGCRKTSFCRCLALSPELFEDNLGELSRPDAAIKVQGSLVVEMPELSSIKYTRHREAVKAFLTRINDSYRILYTGDMAKPSHRCVFIGTTNDYDFMSGSFWNRRFLPIECGLYEPGIDWTDEDAVRHFFEQVWAEAIVWYKRDPKGITKTLTPSSTVLEECRKMQDRFKTEDPWYAPIENYLGENEDREICAKEIMVKALRIDSNDRKVVFESCKKIHELMRNLFPAWERVSCKTRRMGEWGPQNTYYVHRCSYEQIEKDL